MEQKRVHVTICPPCNSFPKSPAPKKKVWHCPQNGHDKEICAECQNKGRCEKPCAPLIWIDGNVIRKENFINPRMLQFDHPDYKTILYDLSNHRNPPNRLEEITAIANTRYRAICAMLMVKIPKPKIARIMGMSRMQLHRILESMQAIKKGHA